jgi:hypothetical protein
LAQRRGGALPGAVSSGSGENLHALAVIQIFQTSSTPVIIIPTEHVLHNGEDNHDDETEYANFVVTRQHTCNVNHLYSYVITQYHRSRVLKMVEENHTKYTEAYEKAQEGFIQHFPEYEVGLLPDKTAWASSASR